MSKTKTSPALRAAQRRYDQRRPRISFRLPHHTKPHEVKEAAYEAGYESVSAYIQEAIDTLVSAHRST